jgi:hypothetical protein
MNPTVFHARVGGYDEFLNQILKLFSKILYVYFYHSSSYQTLLNIWEIILLSIEILILKWLFIIQLADI